MALVLYGHPFSSYTQKVLIALYENATPFEFRCIGPDAPEHVADWLRRWPIAKFPLLLDRDRQVVETSIIIDYLDRHHRGSVRFVPEDPDRAREVRFWDRVCDLYLQVPMQKIVLDRLRPADGRDPIGLEEARALLATALGMVDAQAAASGKWLAGEAFSLADCAAAPALH